MWLIVGQLPMKAWWRDAPFALWNFSRNNKYLQNFSLNWQFWLFGPVLPQTDIASQKRKSDHQHWTINIRISLDTKFQLKLIIVISWTNVAPKKVFPIENEKVTSITEFCIFRIWLPANFQLKLIILTFWTKFVQKGHFQLKTKNVEWPLNSAYSN